MLAGRPRTMVWTGLAIAILGIAFRFGLFGSFRNPSFLPGFAGYFAIGIACRLGYSEVVGSVRHPWVILALCIALLPLGWDPVPILVWTLVFAGMVLNPAATHGTLFVRAYKSALESYTAIYLGSRSYSTYLCHMPIIAICHWVWLAIFPLALKPSTFFAVSAMTVPLILISAELLYRGVERPGIALGSKLVRRNKIAASAI
jgi:peptidoglycan/LPS O-acetylase OafA/YrhL